MPPQGGWSADISEYKRGGLITALPHLSRALEISPDEPGLYCYRAVLHWLLKDEKPAIEDGEKAVALAPEHPEPYARLGMALMLRLNFG